MKTEWTINDKLQQYRGVIRLNGIIIKKKEFLFILNIFILSKYSKTFFQFEIKNH